MVVATRPGPLWADKCRAAGISHAAIPMPSGTDLRSVRRLVQLIREHRIEIVHCHKGKARTLSLLAGLFVRIPVLVVHRGVSFPVGWNRLGYLHPRVRAIVVICRALKEGLVAAGVPEGKIEVIYRGTDLDRFHPRVDGRASAASSDWPTGSPSSPRSASGPRRATTICSTPWSA